VSGRFNHSEEIISPVGRTVGKKSSQAVTQEGSYSENQRTHSGSTDDVLRKDFIRNFVVGCSRTVLSWALIKWGLTGRLPSKGENVAFCSS